MCKDYSVSQVRYLLVLHWNFYLLPNLAASATVTVVWVCRLAVCCSTQGIVDSPARVKM